jgi:hypothetical protein
MTSWIFSLRFRGALWLWEAFKSIKRRLRNIFAARHLKKALAAAFVCSDKNSSRSFGRPLLMAKMIRSKGPHGWLWIAARPSLAHHRAGRARPKAKLERERPASMDVQDSAAEAGGKALDTRNARFVL